MQQLHDKKGGDHTFYRYGQLTQHIQNRDEASRLEQVAFQRGDWQDKSNQKREKLSKLAQFKLGITEE